jgi:serine/threonine protein kinase
LLDRIDFIICKICNTKNEFSSRFCKSCGKQIRDDVFDSDILLLQTYLGDKFSISKPLGEGGFARVFLAEHKALGRKEVIKLLGFEQSKNPEIKARFLQEARILASLNHPGIINLRDVSEAGGRPYYIMEYKDGGSLHDFFKKNQPLQLQVVIELILKLLKALTVIHKKGILHRDLKPDNVLINEAGEPVLIDFGIARLEDGDSSNKTKTGISLGTPAYMSPEQWEGKKISERSDLYSIGILFYELLTGQVPFSSLEVFSKELPRSSSLPEELYIFLQKACAKDPLKRFSSAEEMTQALENLTHTKIQSKPNIPPKENQSVLQTEEAEKQKRFGSNFINDFLFPFRKDLTWKSILIKQLRIFLSISVIPFVFFILVLKDILIEIPVCMNSSMKMDELFCYYDNDKESYENAENICKSVYKGNSSKEDKICIKKNYIGKVSLNEYMEKPYYELRINYLQKNIYIVYIFFLIYPIYIIFQILKYFSKYLKIIFLSLSILVISILSYKFLIQKDTWIGIIYPDKNNLYNHKIIGEFNSINSCLDKVNILVGENGTYECGLNCKTETMPMICEKTVGNEK